MGALLGIEQLEHQFAGLDAAVWSDLGKLRNRIDGPGILESDLPPSWWQQQQISA